MAATNFYANKQVSSLGSDIVFKSYDMHLSKFEYEGTGVYTTASQKFTPAVSPGWIVNDYQSTVKKNLFFNDDTGFLCSVKVASNTAADVTIVAANAFRVVDGTTVAVLTNTSTYNFYILTPNASSDHGEFFGYTKLGEFNPNVTKVPLITGVPAVKIRTDIGGVQPEMKGDAQNVSAKQYKNLMSMKTYGSQTGQVSTYFGNDYSIGGYWEIKLVGSTVAGKANVFHFWKCNLSLDGGINFGEATHKTVKFSADILINPLVEDSQANMVGVSTAT
jgi:hypothetical protein